jgi:hypothetical protein
MQDKDKDAAADFYRRADMVREIAEGIFDKTDRRVLLKFVSDSEKRVAQRGRKVPGR